MNIYKVSRTDKIGYEEFDSFVTVAKDAESARNTHPRGANKNWDADWNGWVPSSKKSSLDVVHIGTSNECYHKGEIILASFNAG